MTLCSRLVMLGFSAMRLASAKVVALNRRPDGLAAPIVQRMLIRFKHVADPSLRVTNGHCCMNTATFPAGA